MYRRFTGAFAFPQGLSTAYTMPSGASATTFARSIYSASTVLGAPLGDAVICAPSA
jgi:hypothetical protein